MIVDHERPHGSGTFKAQMPFEESGGWPLDATNPELVGGHARFTGSPIPDGNGQLRA